MAKHRICTQRDPSTAEGIRDRRSIVRCGGIGRILPSPLPLAQPHPVRKLNSATQRISNPRGPSVSESTRVLSGQCKHRAGHVVQQCVRGSPDSRHRKPKGQVLPWISWNGDRCWARDSLAPEFGSLVWIPDRYRLRSTGHIQRLGVHPPRFRRIQSEVDPIGWTGLSHN